MWPSSRRSAFHLTDSSAVSTASLPPPHPPSSRPLRQQHPRPRPPPSSPSLLPRVTTSCSSRTAVSRTARAPTRAPTTTRTTRTAFPRAVTSCRTTAGSCLPGSRGRSSTLTRCARLVDLSTHLTQPRNNWKIFKTNRIIYQVIQVMKKKSNLRKK